LETGIVGFPDSLPQFMYQNIHPKRMEDECCNPGKCTCTVFKDKWVCKNFFLKSIYISNKRFSKVVKKTEPGVCLKNERGWHEPSNKIP
jgi:hypothetical protein